MGGEPEEWPVTSEITAEKFKDKVGGDIQVATFGAGCFWGTEKYFAKNFEKEHPGSIIATSVGFMSPDPNGVENPSYDDVCEGTTGHVEVAQILFDKSKTNFRDLVRFFFTFHDPTTFERQGGDTGS